MKVNFDSTINKLGTTSPLQMDGGDGKTVDATLARVACEALLSFDPQVKESGEQKAKCYALALRAVRGGEIEVTAEEIALIKSKVGDTFAPAVVGPAYELLEQRVVGEA